MSKSRKLSPLPGVIPQTTKYLGMFGSCPKPTEAGQWWYDLHEGTWDYFDGVKIKTVGNGAKEIETEWSTDPVVDNVASDALTTLTTHTITAESFVYPIEGTEVRVILLAMLSVVAQAEAIHHIGLKVQMQVNDGGWADLKDFTANPPLGIPADGGMGSWTMPIDITDSVASGDKLEFRFAVDSDNAGSMNYTTSFLVTLIYKTG